MIDEDTAPQSPAERYSQAMAELRDAFFAGNLSSVDALRARSDAADTLLEGLWHSAIDQTSAIKTGVAVLAVGGYGRRQLFPASDLDVLFVAESSGREKATKDCIRRVTQQLWDSGIRVASTTRLIAECERFLPENVEFTLSLFDSRPLTGDLSLVKCVQEDVLHKVVQRDRKAIGTRLVELTQERHKRYGNTLFHLEPNVKECPGGIRDANVCGWMERLATGSARPSLGFSDAFAFMAAVRCFLHLRSERDVNALDWRTQDDAAAAGIGVPGWLARDPAHWMQLYFRHARAIARQLDHQLESMPKAVPFLRMPLALRPKPQAGSVDVRVERGRTTLQEVNSEGDPAKDPDAVLRAFQLVAESGARLAQSTEDRLESAIPVLAAHLEEGGALWQRLRLILLGPFAGAALRSMHALGLLELLLPEFHGIDALVIRDAYHRYTVDEHTFVVIDTLHSFAARDKDDPLGQWEKRFAAIARDLQHPDLLYLAALLHDTGKGRSTAEHTQESARLAASVVQRLELDEYESRLVLTLIRNHLEMSAALRRDIFDAETVRTFANCVQTPEELRLLTLFTYADIGAVHPDALTPWKAENLWRLYIATSNYLDRNIDDERIDSRVSSELILHVIQNNPAESREMLQFLEGFPQRYLQTRSPEQVQSHFHMSRRLSEDAVQLDFRWSPERSEISLVTPDKRLLFARVAGVLAAWGMNVITADAFSNAAGIVVDSFRFTDTYKTLEKNASERERLVRSVHDAIADPALAAEMIANRKRSRRRAPLVRVETSVQFDTESSTHATLLQVVAQDLPGLLYCISTTLGEARCNIKVAVIDTEGETAIDVFYITFDDQPLDRELLTPLREKLLTAIRENGG